MLFRGPACKTGRNAPLWRAVTRPVAVALTGGLIRLLAQSATTQAAVDRLWIFIVPLVCILAGYGYRSSRLQPAIPLHLLLYQQVIIVLLIKMGQDFY